MNNSNQEFSVKCGNTIDSFKNNKKCCEFRSIFYLYSDSFTRSTE